MFKFFTNNRALKYLCAASGVSLGYYMFKKIPVVE